MNEEIEEQEAEAVVSEQPEVESQERQEEEQKMVPLAALMAQKKKLREQEARALQAEAKAQAMQELLSRNEEKNPQEPEDPNALVEKHVLNQANAETKRDILETLYRDMNPEAVQKINLYLDPILKKKPWLAASVDSAQNRYARAYEIVQDYLHLVEEKPIARQLSNNDGKKIVQNANKPRSPAEIGKSQQPTGVEFLKSMQGKKEFREYRQKMLQGGY